MADRITVTLHELVSELDRYADAWLRSRYQVSYNLFEFLAALAERQPIDITGLAQCLGVSKAAVSKRVPAIAADGWIVTTPGGGRRVELGLTPKGARLVEEAGGELEREFTAILADPRLDPGRTPEAVEPEAFHGHLRTLTQIILEKGLPS